MPRQTEYKLQVTIKADPKSEQRFFQKLAHEMVEQIMGKPKEQKIRIRKPKVSLEKPPTKRKSRKKYKKGPTVNRSKDLDFSKEEVRRRETRKLIRRMAKEQGLTVREMAVRMRFNDFRKNRLGLIMNNHDNSPYKAVVEAYPKWNIMPWEMRYGLRHFWKSRKNRAAATKYVLRKSHKKPENLAKQDFLNAGLERLLAKHSIYSLLVDAGYAYSLKEIRKHARIGQFKEEKIYPWQLANPPNRFYKEAFNRKCMTKWMVWAMGEPDPKDVRYADFVAYGLGGVLSYFYNDRLGGYKAALSEAGFSV